MSHPHERLVAKEAHLTAAPPNPASPPQLDQHTPQPGRPNTRPLREPKSLAQQIRRWVVGVIIVSFAIAALGGIIVLLSGAFSETAGKVLGTTALTGLFSVAVLCGIALVGKRAQWFGWATVVISIITLVRLLWLIWAEPNWGDHSFELTITMCIITAACAVASLLLLLSAHDRAVVRVLLYVTLGFIALGVLLSLLAIWRVIPDDPENFWRGTGVVWILAALGVVVVPVMSLLMRAPKATAAAAAASPQYQATPPVTTVAPQPAGSELPAAAQTQLSPNAVAHLTAAANAAGVSPDEFVNQLLAVRSANPTTTEPGTERDEERP